MITLLAILIVLTLASVGLACTPHKETRQVGSVPKSVKLSRHRSGILNCTGESALIQDGNDGYIYAQFDNIDHPHSHGWWPYPKEVWNEH